MSGGWRSGAGRPGWRGKTSSRLQLDVRRLAREGLLVAGSHFAWSWRADGQKIGSVGIRVTSESGLALDYSSNGRTVCLPISLARTDCNYGGSRIWFNCPRCSKRCAIVYCAGDIWPCRQCLRLSYGSQSDDRIGRTWRKQSKIESKLAGGKGEWNGWQKPKGMHQATFSRLIEKIYELESVRDDALYRFAARYARFL
jgi:hypothetical protein